MRPFPPCRAQVAQEQIQRRRLARPIWTEETEDATDGHSQVEVLDGDEGFAPQRPKNFRQAVRLYRPHALSPLSGFVG